MEFKAKPSHLASEMVAFANASGGSIFVGITDDGQIVGAGVSNLTTATWQPTLFDKKRTQKLKDYYRSIDKIRNRYGTDAVRIFKEGRE